MVPPTVCRRQRFRWKFRSCSRCATRLVRPADDGDRWDAAAHEHRGRRRRHGRQVRWSNHHTLRLCSRRYWDRVLKIPKPSCAQCFPSPDVAALPRRLHSNHELHRRVLRGGPATGAGRGQLLSKSTSPAKQLRVQRILRQPAERQGARSRSRERFWIATQRGFRRSQS